jgi:DNA repair protein RecN (Recombination protein N)
VLSELRIQNFAIIRSLDLRLGAGFTVFTGETGAGKSIMVDAVALLLGSRADGTMVREGTELALIEGTFEIEPDRIPELWSLLEQEQLIEGEASLVLAREIRREGRNICRINGRTVSLGVLKSIARWLVDVHGQSEHLSLLRVKEHLALLDRFAATDLAAYQEIYRQLRAVRREIGDLERTERETARREDLLRYQVSEIDSADLQPGETAGLQAERDRLANAEKLAGLALNALSAMGDGSRPAFDRLGDVAGALLSLAEIDPSMKESGERAQGLSEELERLSVELKDYLEQVQPDPIRLDEVEARLSLIRDMKRKYGDDTSAVLDFARQAQQELELIEHAEVHLESLREEQQKLLEQLSAAAQQLSALRSQSGVALSEAIIAHLAELNMEGAQFAVEISQQEDPEGVPVGNRRLAFGPTGFDAVEFLVAPNVGEGLKPLVKIASGGETSRLMLGLKSVLAKADLRPTLIFDEIDQGIGGRIGSVVGQKLKQLASDHQVLCVTHLPQLAAHADQHFQVGKRVDNGRTLTEARSVEGELRLAELAEMLGGRSEANRRSAETLLLEVVQSG